MQNIENIHFIELIKCPLNGFSSICGGHHIQYADETKARDWLQRKKLKDQRENDLGTEAS